MSGRVVLKIWVNESKDGESSLPAWWVELFPLKLLIPWIQSMHSEDTFVDVAQRKASGRNEEPTLLERRVSLEKHSCIMRRFKMSCWMKKYNGQATLLSVPIMVGSARDPFNYGQSVDKEQMVEDECLQAGQADKGWQTRNKCFRRP